MVYLRTAKSSMNHPDRVVSIASLHGGGVLLAMLSAWQTAIGNAIRNPAGAHAKSSVVVDATRMTTSRATYMEVAHLTLSNRHLSLLDKPDTLDTAHR